MEMESRIARLEERQQALERDVKEIKQQLANRLPLWATVLMSLGPTGMELPAKAPSWHLSWHLMRWS